MADLITLTTKTRGRNSKEVEYQGLGRIVKDEKGNEEVETKGVLTSLEDAMKFVDNNVQKFLDIWVDGFNRFQREAAIDVDEFAGFIDASWDEKKTDAFKRSVRALAKVAEMETADAAELILSKMKKAEPVTA